MATGVGCKLACRGAGWLAGQGEAAAVAEDLASMVSCMWGGPPRHAGQARQRISHGNASPRGVGVESRGREELRLGIL
jgi:hypothetical protein